MAGLRLGDGGLHGGDDLVGGNVLRRIEFADADIVDAQQDHHVRRAGNTGHVVGEAGHRRGADAIVDPAIAGDGGIDHARAAQAMRRGLHAVIEIVGPAAVGVGGGAVAVGDRVAEGDDDLVRMRRQVGDAGIAGRRCIHLAEPVVLARGGGVAHRRGGGLVARGEVIGLHADGVGGDDRRVQRHEQADRQIRMRGERQVDGIAPAFFAGCERQAAPAVEAEHLVGGKVDAAIAGAAGNTGFAEGDGRGSEVIGELDADQVSAVRGVHDLPNGLVRDRQRRNGSAGKQDVVVLRRGIPGREPRRLNAGC